MLRLAPPLALLIAGLAAVASAKPATVARRPVVVELYTSQGCSACTRANVILAGLADRPDVLALTFPVDYWDYPGWKDTFARPEFAARQRLYQKAAGLREGYPPQVVVDGAARADKAAADNPGQLIRAALKAHGPTPRMTIAGARLAIGPGAPPPGGAEAWLVRYSTQPQETEVKDGENRGVTVVYRNVARGLVRLGAWTGKAKAYPLPKPDGDLGEAVLLQARSSGRILAVLRR